MADFAVVIDFSFNDGETQSIILDTINVQKVHFERRVADHEIELTELLTIVAFVVRGNEGVALDGMVERRHKPVEQEVEFQHLVGALRNILSKNGTLVLAYLMAESHEECASASRGVVALDVVQILVVAHKQTRHNSGNSMRGVVFGIFATTSCIIVLDKIFENIREKIVIFIESLLEREIDQCIDQSPSK